MYFGPAYTMIEAGRLAHDAQHVIAFRLMGMMGWTGTWSETRLENSRMVSEKPASFHKAWTAASDAVLRGKTPDAVVRAYLGPLTTTASANRKRLAGGTRPFSIPETQGLKREPNP